MNLLLAILSQVAVFLPLSIGVYINSVILKITDLTIDGSFLIGAATFTFIITHKQNPFFAVIAALIAGAIIGLISSIFQTKKRIDPIIASILTVFLAHGLFFIILSGPNVGLHGQETLLTLFPIVPKWLIPLTISTILTLIISKILSSTLGITLKAFGTQEKVLYQIGKNTEFYRHIGLSLSNACAGLAGALTAQQNGYADISMGFGMALIGIASVLIGKHFFRIFKENTKSSLFFCYIGSTIYFVFITALLISGVNPLYLKGIFAIILGLTLHLTT
jgi:putative ABC transport system permease protein